MKVVSQALEIRSPVIKTQSWILQESPGLDHSCGQKWSPSLFSGPRLSQCPARELYLIVDISCSKGWFDPKFFKDIGYDKF